MAQDNNKDTKQQILDVSLDLFASKGFSGTSMREISEHVGIRKSSIYNHFSSKNDLIKTLLDSLGPGFIMEKYNEFIQLEDLNDPYKLFKEFGEQLYKIIKKPEEQKYMQLLLREHNSKMVTGVLKKYWYNKNGLFWTDFFKNLIEKGLIKKGNPVVYANEFAGPLIFFRLIEILLVSEGEEFDDLKEYIDNHIDFFWNAVKKD